ncbi:MAG: ZPR1 zinc finger domain-containing protein [Candidatus Thermoplasmatota archaeon]|nr:ZPR1 zinc finger domain-containing protein [Candidatus Thermoplasmatota archaeon]MDA8142750.1 ZPR1 zinc finger domain-containing protein [Thermoplasmatales archaeon]
MSNEDISEEFPKEFDTESICPSCGKKLTFIFHRTKISYEEAIEIESYFCKSCLYKSNEIRSLEREEPKKLVFGIRNSGDIRTILYRSPEARIEIPELNVDIEPGEISTGEITTVEGVLQGILEKIDLFDEEDADVEVLRNLKERIQGIINGNGENFTLVIDDPRGKSRINSSRVIILRHAAE